MYAHKNAGVCVIYSYIIFIFSFIKEKYIYKCCVQNDRLLRWKRKKRGHLSQGRDLCFFTARH